MNKLVLPAYTILKSADFFLRPGVILLGMAGYVTAQSKEITTPVTAIKNTAPSSAPWPLPSPNFETPLLVQAVTEVPG